VKFRATSLLFPETSGEGPLTAEAEVEVVFFYLAHLTVVDLLASVGHGR
jgi:hypothetical protein